MGVALCAQQLTVAVSSFDVRNGVTADVAEVVTELFTANLVATGKMRVVDRNGFDKIIAEMKFQASDWANSSRVAQLGKALNANSIIRGNVSALAGQIVITAYILDINTAQILSASSVRVNNTGQIFDRIPSLSNGVVTNLTNLSNRSNTALGQYTVVISPFDIRGGMQPGDAGVLMDMFTTLVVINGAKVVDRNSFERIAREMQFQASDWSDGTRLAQLGRALNANAILRGSIMSLAGQTVITASILDINTAQILSSSTLQMGGVVETFTKLPDFVKPIITKLPVPSNFKPFVGRWRSTYNYESTDKNKPRGSLEIILNIQDNGTIVVERFDTITTTNDVIYSVLFGDTYIYTYGSPNRYGGGTGTYTYTTNRDSFQLNMTLNLTGIASEIPSSQTITAQFDAMQPNSLQSSGNIRNVYYIERVALIPTERGAISRGWRSFSRITN